MGWLPSYHIYARNKNPGFPPHFLSAAEPEKFIDNYPHFYDEKCKIFCIDCLENAFLSSAHCIVYHALKFPSVHISPIVFMKTNDIRNLKTGLSIAHFVLLFALIRMNAPH